MRTDCRVLAVSCLLALLLPTLALAASADERPRVIVLTDISNEPDDEESMVRFLVYSNELDVEGLIATTSTHLRNRTREDLIRRQIEAYNQVRENLAKHAPGFPTKDELLAVTHTGQPAYGMGAVGPGKATAGSKHIIEVVDRQDDRPVWVSVWGGANTLAQSLRDVRETRSPAELPPVRLPPRHRHCETLSNVILRSFVVGRATKNLSCRSPGLRDSSGLGHGWGPCEGPRSPRQPGGSASAALSRGRSRRATPLQEEVAALPRSPARAHGHNVHTAFTMRSSTPRYEGPWRALGRDDTARMVLCPGDRPPPVPDSA